MFQTYEEFAKQLFPTGSDGMQTLPIIEQLAGINENTTFKKSIPVQDLEMFDLGPTTIAHVAAFTLETKKGNVEGGNLNKMRFAAQSLILAAQTEASFIAGGRLALLTLKDRVPNFSSNCPVAFSAASTMYDQQSNFALGSVSRAATAALVILRKLETKAVARTKEYEPATFKSAFKKHLDRHIIHEILLQIPPTQYQDRKVVKSHIRAGVSKTLELGIINPGISFMDREAYNNKIDFIAARFERSLDNHWNAAEKVLKRKLDATDVALGDFTVEQRAEITAIADQAG